MRKEIIVSDRAPKAIGPYSQGVRAGSFVFFSGQIPLDPVSGEIRGGNSVEQAETVMENIGQLLSSVGLDFSDVVKTTIFLANMSDFAEVNKVYAKRFSSDPPARSTVEVSALPRSVLIEIEVVALCRS